jgi:hypothetical protein
LTPAMNLLANESGLRKLSSYSPAVWCETGIE